MATTTNLNSLVINYLTQAQYDAAATGGTLNENQLYLTPAETLATVATSGSYNDLSDKPTPLVGTTATVTPTQVLTALQAGRDIQISHTDSTYGTITASYFNYSQLFNDIYTNVVTEIFGVYYSIELRGKISDNIWSLYVTHLAKYDLNDYLKSATPSANDNSTNVATTAYVDRAVGGVTTTSTELIRWTEV